MDGQWTDNPSGQQTEGKEGRWLPQVQGLFLFSPTTPIVRRIEEQICDGCFASLYPPEERGQHKERIEEGTSVMYEVLTIRTEFTAQKR